LGTSGAPNATVNQNLTFNGSILNVTGSVEVSESIRVSGSLDVSGSLNVSGSIGINQSLLSNQQNLDVDSGATRVIATLSTTLYDAGFFDFVVKKGTNRRAGTLYVVHNGTTVEFTETSTNDIGNTDDVTLSADISSGNIRMLAQTVTNDWIIKTLVRGI